MKRELVVFHRNCLDGFCGAFIYHENVRERQTRGEIVESLVDYLPYNYGEPLPDIEVFRGKKVTLVDISFTRHHLEKCAAIADGFLVLDHHKTAEQNLAGLDFCIFDMNRSGAAMMWDHLYPGQPRPAIVDYVQDRDLWKFELRGSEFISNILQATPLTFEDWAGLSVKFKTGLDQLIEAGYWVHEWKKRAIEAALVQVQEVTWMGHKGGIVNFSTNGLFSEVAGEIAKKYAFGCVYFMEGKQYRYSLRSRGQGGIDVSTIASFMNGGGHRNAAGFHSEHHPSKLAEVMG